MDTLSSAQKRVTHRCPCSYNSDSLKECHCTGQMIQKYMAKVSGPLLDRIDLHIEVAAIKYKELSSTECGESSETVRARVSKVREIQTQRVRDRCGVYANATMQSKDIRESCTLGRAGEETNAQRYHQTGPLGPGLR
jgi:magnesium chelatase family protein